MRIGRIVVAAIATEVLAVLVLVLLVAALGPRDTAGAQAFAGRLGYWVGPIAGFGFCVLGGAWVARGLVRDHLANGLGLGLAAAALDVGILILSGAAFQPIFVASNLGRVIAGSLGGWLASRGESSAA